MYLPSLPAIGDELGASDGQVQSTLTAFFAGFCGGMLVYGPLSDRLGRRPVLIVGTLLYTLASLGCALMPAIEALVALRFAQALGGAAASVLSRTVIRDLFGPAESARALSLMMAVMAVAPLLAPLLGAQVLLLAGWRAIFAVLAVFGLASFAVVWWLLPESLPPGRRLSGPLSQAFMGYARVLGRPLSLGYVVCGTAAFGGMFAFLTAGSLVYQRHFGLSANAFAILFALNVCGIIGANLLNRALVPRIGTGGVTAAAATAALVAGIGLLVAALTGIGGVAGVVVCVVCYIAVLPMLGANCLAELMANFPSNAGAAAATYSVSQFGLAAIVSLIVPVVSGGGSAPFGMAVTMCACGAISFTARCLLPRLTGPGSSAFSSP